MDINKMSKSDFLSIRRREWNEEVGEFDYLVIIPGNSRDLHDSGYRHITYCLCKGNEPICLTSGGSDVIHLDGIGGYGQRPHNYVAGLPHMIPPSGWNMDCLPKTGYLCLWANSKLVCDADLSSFEVYATGKNRK